MSSFDSDEGDGEREDNEEEVSSTENYQLELKVAFNFKDWN